MQGMPKCQDTAVSVTHKPCPVEPSFWWAKLSSEVTTDHLFSPRGGTEEGQGSPFLLPTALSLSRAHRYFCACNLSTRMGVLDCSVRIEPCFQRGQEQWSDMTASGIVVHRDKT